MFISKYLHRIDHFHLGFECKGHIVIGIDLSEIHRSALIEL